MSMKMGPNVWVAPYHRLIESIVVVQGESDETPEAARGIIWVSGRTLFGGFLAEL